MKKKLLAGAITLLSVATLAACSNGLIAGKRFALLCRQYFPALKANAY